MRRFVARAALVAALGALSGCQSIHKPWQQTPGARETLSGAPLAADQAEIEANRRNNNKIMIPPQSGYTDSPVSP